MASDRERVASWHLAHRGDEPSFAAQADAVLARIPPGEAPVLDLGCGSAPLGERLLAAGHRFAGADRDAAMLGAARRRCPDAPLVLCPARELPFRSGTFKAVAALGLFEYLPEPEMAIAEIDRVLGSGGRALLTVPRREAPYRRGLAGAAPLLDAAGREDPFDLRAGRVVTPADAARWARGTGLALRTARPVAPAVVPWPLDRVLPRLAARLADRAPVSSGTAWLFEYG